MTGGNLLQMIMDCGKPPALSEIPSGVEVDVFMRARSQLMSDLRKTGESVCLIPFEELPLHINDMETLFRKMVQWRLENNL